MDTAGRTIRDRTAEGIETPAQLAVVRSLGFGAGQGYLLGRPAERPPTESIDLDSLVRRGEWPAETLRTSPVSPWSSDRVRGAMPPTSTVAAGIP